VTYIVAGVAVDIHLTGLVFGGGLALSHCGLLTMCECRRTQEKWVLVERVKWP
jgi:hypothetical protein